MSTGSELERSTKFDRGDRYWPKTSDDCQTCAQCKCYIQRNFGLEFSPFYTFVKTYTISQIFVKFSLYQLKNVDTQTYFFSWSNDSKFTTFCHKLVIRKKCISDLRASFGAGAITGITWQHDCIELRVLDINIFGGTSRLQLDWRLEVEKRS